MSRKHYFFDLDNTLVYTDDLRPHRNTHEGKAFIAEHPDQVPTQKVDDDLTRLVISLHRQGKASIATNTPSGYARALLAKHGFPPDIPVYPALNKPLSSGLQAAINSQGIRPQDALVIGDSARDILAAHGCKAASIGVSWGEGTPAKLAKAEPTEIVDDISDLEDAIQEFERGAIAYSPRASPSTYLFLPEDRMLSGDPQVTYASTCTYYPTGHPSFRHSWSGEILAFKRSKDFTRHEIKEKAKDDYFWNGAVRSGHSFIWVFSTFKQKLIEQIEALNLHGSSYVVAAPNSFPEFCYCFDVNQFMAERLNDHLGTEHKSKRRIFRVFPKGEAHNYGGRNEFAHFRTMGIKNCNPLAKASNIIIFDDITTSHCQIGSIATMFRQLLGYSGNIYGLTIGQTESY